MKRILFIDCQLLQTSALHRGMGKYTLAVLNEYKTIKLPYEKVIILLGNRNARTEDEDYIEDVLSNFEIKRLPLKKTDPTKPEEYGAIVAGNRALIDSYISRDFSEYSVDFLITSMFQEDGCSAFPDVAINKFLLIYDLIPLQFPDYYLKDKRGKYQYLSRYKELFKATHYFTISKTVANDLSLQLGISLDKITPIDGSYISRRKLKALKPDIMKDNEKFILMPTGDDARKNNLRAATAFEEFNSKSGYAYKLVITSFFSEKTIKELSMQSNHIIFTGNIAENELAWLYHNAELILFPSEYEGLGMPALEAVEFDKPILCSSVDVFKEISETGFYFCDPYSIEDISQQLQKLLINNKPKVNQKEYNRILSRYSWEATAKRTVSIYEASANVPRIKVNKKIKVAVFGPVPSGYSAIGKVIQEQHYEFSQYAEVDYFLEDGVTERAKTSDIRVNYLPFIANCKNPWSFDSHEAAKYDLVIYNIGNSEYHIATIIKALAFPGEIVLHDTGLGEIFSLIKDRGYISLARYAQERLLQNAIILKKGATSAQSNFIASLVNVSKRVVVHSEYANNAVAEMLIEDNESKIRRLGLPTPTPFVVYDTAPRDSFVVGYAGVLHPAKGLNMVADIASMKYNKPIALKLFGFSLLSDEAKKALEEISNVMMIFKPSDARFIHELETCSVIIGFRPDYHGETSLSTLESLRLGRPVIVNNVGWFKELPEGVVYKASQEGDVPNIIMQVISEEYTKEKVDARVEFVRKYHNTKQYVLGLIDKEV